MARSAGGAVSYIPVGIDGNKKKPAGVIRRGQGLIFTTADPRDQCYDYTGDNLDNHDRDFQKDRQGPDC